MREDGAGAEKSEILDLVCCLWEFRIDSPSP